MELGLRAGDREGRILLWDGVAAWVWCRPRGRRGRRRPSTTRGVTTPGRCFAFVFAFVDLFCLCLSIFFFFFVVVDVFSLFVVIVVRLLRPSGKGVERKVEATL